MSQTSYNDHKSLSSNWKKIMGSIVTGIGVIVAAVFVLKYSIPFVRSLTGGLATSEAIAIMSIVVTVVISVYKAGEKIFSRTFYIKKSISISTECVDNYVIITCKIANRDTRRIIPSNVYLIVEAGLDANSSGDIVKFPYLLHHEQGKNDCVLGTECKRGGLKDVPNTIIDEEFKQLNRKMIRLEHLCAESRRYIDPGEEFAEDTVIKLDKGAYRATVVWTSVNDDCICALKEFVVQ